MDNINDIISSLSSDDIEMLKGVASSILGDEDAKPQNNALSGLNLSPSDINMMMKAKSILDKMNNTSSKDVDLIMALKPHLSDESKEKADKAMRILKILEILPYIKDMF